MQAIRQSLTICTRRVTLVRPTSIVQQVRFDGSDPNTSTSSENHRKSSKQSGSSNDSDLNKSKGGDKKRKSSTTDDTNQPGATEKDWNNPNQAVGRDTQYGKAGGSTDTHNPDKGKN